MEIMTVNEVAKLVKESTRNLQRKAKNGFFPAKVCGRTGRQYLFNKEELLLFIFSGTSKGGKNECLST